MVALAARIFGRIASWGCDCELACDPMFRASISSEDGLSIRNSVRSSNHGRGSDDAFERRGDRRVALWPGVAFSEQR